MTKRRALITGITGQDGYYLSKFLLEQDYDVFGIIRRHSNADSELGHVIEFQNDIKFEYGDILDTSSLELSLHRSKPHEIYNLAAQSHVRVSFDMPQFTMMVNSNGVLNLLESTKRIVPYARLYQASTSEMFGNNVDSDGYQRESTPMSPVSPYGVAKLSAHHTVNQYRKSGMFACSGILFNHESPKRGGNFVTKKIAHYVKQFKSQESMGELWIPPEKLKLGNLSASRDWGHAKDYVVGMWMMLQTDKPDDYVLSTGESHTVEEFLNMAFAVYNKNWHDWVELDEQLLRPEDVYRLKGDSTKAHLNLGWRSKHSFQDLVNDMVLN